MRSIRDLSLCDAIRPGGTGCVKDSKHLAYDQHGDQERETLSRYGRQGREEKARKGKARQGKEKEGTPLRSCLALPCLVLPCLLILPLLSGMSQAPIGHPITPEKATAPPHIIIKATKTPRTHYKADQVAYIVALASQGLSSSEVTKRFNEQFHLAKTTMSIARKMSSLKARASSRFRSICRDHC